MDGNMQTRIFSHVAKLFSVFKKVVLTTSGTVEVADMQVGYDQRIISDDSHNGERY